jgi:hypothetical protein
VLNGQFNFDKTPLAPVGTKALVFLDPNKRHTWQSHAIDAWYVGPAKKHYRNYRFFIPETKGYRVSGTAKFFPAHCKLPAIEPGDTVRLAAQDLIVAIEKMSNAPIDLNPKHTQALRQLATIFNEAARVDEDKENTTPPRVNKSAEQMINTSNSAPRVNNNTTASKTTQPSTSFDATSPRVLRLQPRVHERTTRNNTPMPTIHEESKQALQRTHQREKPTPQPKPIHNRPRRTIAQYQRAKAIVENNTPDRLPTGGPNYITQDDDEANLANLLFNEALPKITHNTINDPTRSDNVIHQQVLPKTQICSTKTPLGINSNAIQHLLGMHLENMHHHQFIPYNLQGQSPCLTQEFPIEHLCNGVVHPVTNETITKYEKLANDPLMKVIWQKAMCKELGRLAQGYGDKEGTNTIFFMTIEEIKRIPKDRTVTYARIVVDYRPQKDDPNRVRITVGGNLIDYPGELTTRTADLTTSKILWNSIISTPGAKFASSDIGDMYLQTPMSRYEYMKIKASLIPEEFMQEYKLHDKIYNGYIYMEIRRGMYGLPQAGILANKLLKKRLAEDGYFELPHTPGLFTHIS